MTLAPQAIAEKGQCGRMGALIGESRIGESRQTTVRVRPTREYLSGRDNSPSDKRGGERLSPSPQKVQKQRKSVSLRGYYNMVD